MSSVRMRRHLLVETSLGSLTVHRNEVLDSLPCPIYLFRRVQYMVMLVLLWERICRRRFVLDRYYRCHLLVSFERCCPETCRQVGDQEEHLEEGNIGIDRLESH